VPIVKVNSQKRLNKIWSRLPALILIVLSAPLIFAQSGSPTPPPRPSDGTSKPGSNDPPLTTFEEELRAKRAIKMAEKDHQENLNRAREIAQIGKELQGNPKDKSTLDRDSLKKIDRLEKLTKKIRGEAGGEDEEVTIVNRPTDIPSALCQIAEASETLSKNVQNTPRQVVSASVIGNANVLLELIKLLRSFARQP
jgi:hypothetical protein